MERAPGVAPGTVETGRLTVTLARLERTKTEALRAALREGREIDALRIAKGFRALGPHKAAIQRGWDAWQTPSFARALGRDPDRLVREAIAALRALYGM